MELSIPVAVIALTITHSGVSKQHPSGKKLLSAAVPDVLLIFYKLKKAGRFAAAFTAYAHRSDDDWEYLYEDSRFKANPCI
ncbi:hypothetical protein BS639_08120 [Rouxiella silvae]|uniref:Uncharacterized protein n=1 Tax=Rouxiella silvae TaxID=1646373 RepID=A0ABX3U2Q9_9GAMM|nr:hypothetical protein [Rouxiella silvae]KQN46314.1 hypothetical protein ASE93_13640 [Serratia sp. Leaf50]ORJ21750.1 hypothetical protein BS639_08120 [Rouxiella silvae]